MKLSLVAVGRLKKADPEAALFSDYETRFLRLAPRFGVQGLELIEIGERKVKTQAEEGEAMARHIPEDAFIIACDEHGKAMTSPEFADTIQSVRDRGSSQLVFLIGGADGIAPPLLARANIKLSFGKMVWPHKLARVMLAEQLYRAMSILDNSPYHRY